jgi:hypothetical protein
MAHIWKRDGVWVRTVRLGGGGKLHIAFRDFPAAVQWMLDNGYVTPETATEWIAAEANRQPPRERRFVV